MYIKNLLVNVDPEIDVREIELRTFGKEKNETDGPSNFVLDTGLI